MPETRRSTFAARTPLVLALLEQGVPPTLLLDLADPGMSSELILLEERASSVAHGAVPAG